MKWENGTHLAMTTELGNTTNRDMLVRDMNTFTQWINQLNNLMESKTKPTNQIRIQQSNQFGNAVKSEREKWSNLVSHVSCKQPTILQLSRLPATAKLNRTSSPLTNFRINDSENKFWHKKFKQTSWHLTLTTTLTLPENASSSKTHTHYATTLQENARSRWGSGGHGMNGRITVERHTRWSRRFSERHWVLVILGEGGKLKMVEGKVKLIFIWPRIYRRIFSVGKYEHAVGNIHYGITDGSFRL